MLLLRLLLLFFSRGLFASSSFVFSSYRIIHGFFFPGFPVSFFRNGFSFSSSKRSIFRFVTCMLHDFGAHLFLCTYIRIYIVCTLDGITVDVSCQYAEAAPTPEPISTSIPTSRIAISVPLIAPSIDTSFMSPRCPMRNPFPATFARPSPMERLYLLYAVFTISVELMCSGTFTTVSELLSQRGLLHRTESPACSHAFTARLVPSASLAWRAKALSRPSSMSMSIATRMPRISWLAGVNGKLPTSFAFIMSSHEKYTLGSVALSRAASALGDAHA